MHFETIFIGKVNLEDVIRSKVMLGRFRQGKECDCVTEDC